MNVSSTELIEEIRSLAQQFPNRKAECRYVISGKPCCIVGTALYRKGIPLETLAKVNYYGIIAWDESEGAMPFHIELDSPFDLEWLSAVQQNQDNGMTWAEALQHASV